MGNRAFISYEEEGKTVSGLFDLVEENQNYVKIKSNKNIILIPYHKINKIKFQELKGGNE